MNETTVPTKTAEIAPETRETSRTLAPPVDIFEVADGLVVVADLPGVDKGSADIRVDNGMLTIQGQAKSQAPGEALLSEFRLVNYYRQFRLNDEVDQEKIKAEMKHGVLTMELPKAESAKPKRITINVS